MDTLRVFDSALNFIGEIDDFKSCIITRKYIGIETLELTISLASNNVSILNKYCILMAGNYKVFEILHVEIDQEESDILKVISYGFGKTLDKRITIPPAGSAYQTSTGSRDKIVKQYINTNIINPTNVNRKISYMQNAPDQSGTSITDQTRLKNLNDEVIRVLQSGDLGYRFYFDTSAKKIIFDTYPGVDRSITNIVGNAPIIFSREFDNLLTQTYIDSMTSARTQIYVGGSGEADLRLIVEVGTSSGISRFEAFDDANDISDSTELTNKGLSEINLGTQSFEAEINPFGNYTYEEDFDLGDLITIQNSALDLNINTRITEIHEIYQQGQQIQIEVIFGDKYPSLLSEIKNQKKQINQLSASK